MDFFPKQAVILPMTIGISFLMVSCESKVSQCNKLIEIANQAATDTSAVTKNDQKNDSNSLIKTADIMDKAAEKLEAIKLKDEKLQSFQSDFSKMYKDTSKATRAAANGLKNNDLPVAELALKNMKNASSKEKQLVDSMNSYCSGR